MGAQLIEYIYDGDEAVWRKTIEDFFANLRKDPMLADGLTYQVYMREDGRTRIHAPTWRNKLVLDHLNRQKFFADFTAAIQKFAGDSIRFSKPAMILNP